jgi:hypothetical protein
MKLPWYLKETDVSYTDGWMNLKIKINPLYYYYIRVLLFLGIKKKGDIL